MALRGVISKIRAKWGMVIIADTTNPNSALCIHMIRSQWTNGHITYISVSMSTPLAVAGPHGQLASDILYGCFYPIYGHVYMVLPDNYYMSSLFNTLYITVN